MKYDVHVQIYSSVFVGASACQYQWQWLTANESMSHAWFLTRVGTWAKEWLYVHEWEEAKLQQACVLRTVQLYYETCKKPWRVSNVSVCMALHTEVTEWDFVCVCMCVCVFVVNERTTVSSDLCLEPPVVHANKNPSRTIMRKISPRERSLWMCKWKCQSFGRWDISEQHPTQQCNLKYMHSSELWPLTPQ